MIISLQSIFFNILKHSKNILLLVFCLVFSVQFSKSFAQDYQMVWSDEFNGTSLDTSKWNYSIGNGVGGWGNNELEYYRPQNAIVNNGYLTITAKKENYNGFNYTSAKITTALKGDWKYGKFEMRAKLPYGKGIWPAFWMMPTDNIYGGWAASGEIDIMENLGNDTSTVYGTIHYGGAWPNDRSSGSSFALKDSGFQSNFHTFSIIWQQGKIQWLVDGQVYETQTNWYTTGYPFPAPFDQRFYIILNLAVGGNWPGNPDSTTIFPQNYVIDYVRVYQQIFTSIKKDYGQFNHVFSLGQNYPNPFNPSTTIQYEVPISGLVNLTVYNILGQKVAELVNKVQATGKYEVQFNANKLSSGIYFYKLSAGSYSNIKKMIVLK